MSLPVQLLSHIYDIFWNASAKTRRIYYMFALRKPGEERFSKRSEAVVLLSVLLSGVPFYNGVICRLLRLGSCEILERRGRLVPSTSCTGVRLAMLQYYICVGTVLTVVLVLGLGLGFGIILYFVIGT